ncbi:MULTISPECIES: hypothetical protein [Methylococcus]|jgi:hypothetical protein|uniref:Uncharacterized protein n=1 Tax=Methylococcus capsulatus TaxID=414 RepID=A0AA35XZG1_METCP|nr:hypothetical protein [Methylococcus capsulatus]QXP88725.1 hypothetical protein KW112_06375 [Methylococcus capsulatus]QXP89902.1 hypothetical protein KW114_12600 [Methylococcus capsulatus]QXP94243.1 hypothetical protein KW113_03260 [Methylococcus capsulatus]UQN11004.1 hypothetical protein M3M30_08120 [Methylococcus capsulatus]CAI8764710.1 conserved exported protein of unknown function [Methylococcus capsulatus]
MTMEFSTQSRRAGVRGFLHCMGLASLLALGAASNAQAWEEWEDEADNPIQAQCYRVERWGDGYNLEQVGSVTVHSNQQAALICNNVEYACRGRCIACAHDYDYYEDICVDMSGRQFVKP